MIPKITQKGFSILEFLVSMTVLILVFAAVMALFVPLLRGTRTQGGQTQTEIEGIVGLEMLRTDILHAGHGLPWIMNGLTYQEADDTAEANSLNDASNPPRGIYSIDNLNPDGHDYLTIKATNVGIEPASQKVTFIQRGDTGGHLWGDTRLDLLDQDYVTKIRLVDPDTGEPMILLPGTTGFYSQFSGVTPPPATGFVNEIWYIYGIDSGVPRMPFNRADYFIRYADVPARCMPGTGVLVKAVVDHADGKLSGFYPILDCVADFQVVFGVDSTGTSRANKVDCLTNDLATVFPPGDLAADRVSETVRERVGEVRIYILAQEGNFDGQYEFTGFIPGTTRVLVGENPNPKNCTGVGGPDEILGQQFDLESIDDGDSVDNNYLNYRWRVFSLSVHPENLTFSSVGELEITQ